jgi:prepilin-type N-terminal cleavage/methylation domain-containing protein
MKKSKSGFTLVELLVVLVVIGILASIVLITFGNIQAKSRDAKRMADLQNIAEAIGSYRVKFGNDISTGSTCGDGGNGNGWFNYTGGTYTKSILSCLTDASYLNQNVIDPFGCKTTSEAVSSTCKRQGYAYMKYTSGSGDTSVTCVYARLEASGSTSNLTTANPCSSASSSTVATSYGMNYYVLVK